MTVTQQTEPWVPDLTTFAARLAVVRQAMGWNSKEAALACGLPATSWRNWEAGKRPHDFAKVCESIARRTGIPAAWLAFGPDETSRGTTDQYVADMFGSPAEMPPLHERDRIGAEAA